MVPAAFQVILSLINARSNVIILVFSTYAEKQDYIMEEINDDESFKELYEFLDLIKINQKKLKKAQIISFTYQKRLSAEGKE